MSLDDVDLHNLFLDRLEEARARGSKSDNAEEVELP